MWEKKLANMSYMGFDLTLDPIDKIVAKMMGWFALQVQHISIFSG